MHRRSRRQNAEGFVYLVDREDDKIVTRAINVYPCEVENVLYAHPQVRECTVVGIRGNRGGEAVTAFSPIARWRHHRSR